MWGQGDVGASTSMVKRDLLYLSPVIPAISGNGLAMRAGMVLEALAGRHNVNLLTVALYPPFDNALPEFFVRLCRRWTIVRPSEFGRASVFARLTGLGHPRIPYRKSCFDIVHVFRLSMLPFTQHYLEGRPRPQCHLDLDDIESITHRRLASLCLLNGDPLEASIEDSEARRFDMVEDTVLREFDRVYVCSASDREKLRPRARTELRVLPNAVRVPGPIRPRTGNEDFTFLFVGTLGYYPNEDAVLYFARKIVPEIRRRAKRRFLVNLVGAGTSPRLHALAAGSEVRLIGEVPDVRSWYEGADAIVAPLRAGGGTRIKILEAFSYQRPVVSTTIGMEGIDAMPNEHLLIADTPEDFAQACLRLMEDAGLRKRMAERAHALLLRSYTLESLRQRLER